MQFAPKLDKRIHLENSLFVFLCVYFQFLEVKFLVNFLLYKTRFILFSKIDFLENLTKFNTEPNYQKIRLKNDIFRAVVKKVVVSQQQQYLYHNQLPCLALCSLKHL